MSMNLPNSPFAKIWRLPRITPMKVTRRPTRRAETKRQNCCDEPKGISLADYLHLIMDAPKLTAAIHGLTKGTAVEGAWQSLSEPVIHSFEEVVQPLTSFVENIAASVESFFGPASEVAGATAEGLTGEVTEIAAQSVTSASAGAEAGAAEVEAEGGHSLTEHMLGSQTASILSGVATVYAAYAAADLALKLVYS